MRRDVSIQNQWFMYLCCSTTNGNLRKRAFLGPSLREIRAHPQKSRATHPSIMSATQPSFRWRTILELTVIASVIYFFVGAPGLSDVLSSGQKGVAPAPKIHLKPDSLVYPDFKLDCAKHTYDVHIFSAKPLIVYIDGFLTESEADALVELR
jgi:hypothetical protein